MKYVSAGIPLVEKSTSLLCTGSRAIRRLIKQTAGRLHIREEAALGGDRGSGAGEEARLRGCLSESRLLQPEETLLGGLSKSSPG
jgi:hypothetical protein